MNRKKKIRQKLLAKVKKARAKLNPNKKPAYISKADREKMASDARQQTESSED